MKKMFSSFSVHKYMNGNVSVSSQSLVILTGTGGGDRNSIAESISGVKAIFTAGGRLDASRPKSSSISSRPKLDMPISKALSRLRECTTDLFLAGFRTRCLGRPSIKICSRRIHFISVYLCGTWCTSVLYRISGDSFIFGHFPSDEQTVTSDASRDSKASRRRKWRNREHIRRRRRLVASNV